MKSTEVTALRQEKNVAPSIFLHVKFANLATKRGNACTQSLITRAQKWSFRFAVKWIKQVDRHKLLEAETP